MSGRMWLWLRHRAAWGGLFVAALAVLLVIQAAKRVEPYWLDVSSKASISILFLAPGLAALTAWSARRWNAGPAAVSVRHPLSLAVVSVVPAVFWSSVALLVSLLTMARISGVGWGLPHAGVLALAIGVVTTFSLLGHLLATRLPSVYAVPAAFAVAWLWLAFPPTIQPLWVRNVNGNIGTSCCALNQSLVAHALLAPAIVTGGLFLAVVVALSSRRALVFLPVAAMLLGSAVAGGRALMLDVGHDPVRDRIGASVCDPSPPRLCVWPEHGEKMDQAAPVVADVVSRLHAAGVPKPSLVTEETTNRPGLWTVGFGDDPSQWRRIIAEAPVRQLPPTCVRQRRGHWPAAEMYFPLRAWLYDVAGATPNRPVDAAVGDQVARLRRLSPEVQRGWYEANMAALSTCTRKFEPIPTR